jgi:D-alanine-D-alanine ligase
MSKKLIAVLRGGPSSEHDVSIQSGKGVLEALEDLHHTKDIVIDKNGKWFFNGIEVNPQTALQGVDVAFNAMHGEYGEDGEVQKILEMINVPFTGPRALGARLSINKATSKKLYHKHGIKSPYSKIVTNTGNVEQMANTIFRSFPIPMILKPVSKGSSVGILIAKNHSDLVGALEKVFEDSDDILIEEYIDGREATVGVLEKFRDQDIYPLLPTEIKPPTERNFFDYDCKYDGTTEEICPGNFSNEEKQQLQELAVKAHNILGLRHYSRSDFIIHPKRGIYILETNSLPGLTSESLYPKALEPVGSNYREFLEHVIGLALGGK